MGAHSSAESLMAGVESDSIRIKATALAAQMTGWLADPGFDIFAPGEASGYEIVPYAPSDLVEWCRLARDVLEAIGRG